VAAAALVVMLPNAGNFGLSANLFAFGEAGVANAGLFFASSSVLTFTVGVLIASSGNSHPLVAARGLIRVSSVWAVVAALIVNTTGWSLPAARRRTLSSVRGSSRSGQLHSRRACAGVWCSPRSAVLAAAGIALAHVRLLVPRQAGILQAAMPSAVICTISDRVHLEPSSSRRWWW
jgi:predicted permease